MAGSRRLPVGMLCVAVAAVGGRSSTRRDSAPGQPAPAGLSTVADPAPSATPMEAPSDVLLTDQGIGTVRSGSRADAYAELTTLLGAPTWPVADYCNGVAKWAGRDGLSVLFQADGPMLGWSVDDDVQKLVQIRLDEPPILWAGKHSHPPADCRRGSHDPYQYWTP